MDASVEILYREVMGAGDDREAGNDGVVVTLSKWTTAHYDHRLTDHYVLTERVMVGGELAVDSAKIMLGCAAHYDPQMIRQAISQFDALVHAHPVLGVTVKFSDADIDAEEAAWRDQTNIADRRPM